MPMEVFTSILTWLAPILASLVICTGQLALNASFKHAESRREVARAQVERESAAKAEWRDEVTRKLDELEKKIDVNSEATQATMRTELLHLSEKYITRNGATKEEKNAIVDMHKKYSKLDANGFIDTYIKRVMDLPDIEI